MKTLILCPVLLFVCIPSISSSGNLTVKESLFIRGGQYCGATGRWYSCGDALCREVSHCPSNPGLVSCACPVDFASCPSEEDMMQTTADVRWLVWGCPKCDCGCRSKVGDEGPLCVQRRAHALFWGVAVAAASSPPPQCDHQHTEQHREVLRRLPNARKRLCNVTAGQHVQGGWQPKEPSDRPAWPCCSGDYVGTKKGSYLENPCQCGAHLNPFNSEPANVETVLTGRRDFYARSAHHACRCAATLTAAEWVPLQCYLPAWDSRSFCNALGNRTILLVGDSTMHQTATTLQNAAFPFCADQIHYGPSDTLIGIRAGHMNRGKRWLEWVQRVRPDIAIVTAGAHIRPVQAFKGLLKEFLSQYRRARISQKEKGSHFPSTVIWKTQNPAGCGPAILTQADRKGGSWLRKQNSSTDQSMQLAKEYGWDKFELYDKMARSELTNYDIPVLDLDPLYFRVDAHVVGDCLHTCEQAEGPLHLFPVLLARMLHEIDLK